MFQMNMEVRKGILFLRLNGVLNGFTSDELNNEVNRLVLENGIKYFVFNLEGLTSLDQEGLQSIEKNYRQITSRDGEVVLCGMKKIPQGPIWQKIYQSQNELGAFQIIHI